MGKIKEKRQMKSKENGRGGDRRASGLVSLKRRRAMNPSEGFGTNQLRETKPSFYFFRFYFFRLPTKEKINLQPCFCCHYSVVEYPS
jgi:hypothetical protein